MDANILQSPNKKSVFSGAGVVSLLDMLEFFARDYVNISYQFGLLLAQFGKHKYDAETLQKAINRIFEDANKIGLTVTRDALAEMILEFIEIDKTKVSIEDGLVRIKDGSLTSSRFCHHVESLLSTMKSELGGMVFKAVPKDRSDYSTSKWLEKSPIADKFPTSFKEIDRAGQCYAYGQPTASVFHSMRALEPGLAALAKPFSVSSAHENWQHVINQIEGSIRNLGDQKKSQQKIDDERFFGSAVSHLYFVKNAWRNHVAHTRESYSDEEAHKIMHRSLEFVESLCPRLGEESLA